MSNKRCGRCGAAKPSPNAAPLALMDYCTICGLDLCDKCMNDGCCGNIPAHSGMDDDNSEGSYECNVCHDTGEKVVGDSAENHAIVFCTCKTGQQQAVNQSEVLSEHGA